MPVVIDPKPHNSVLKEVICRDSCGALIGYVPKDVAKVTVKDYTGGSDSYKWIICPQCSHKIYVS